MSVSQKPHSRSHIHAPRGLGDTLADRITAVSGSWRFILAHAVWFTLWLALRLDINLLTLIVSLEAIFLSTFVLMSQVRQASKDKTRDDLEAHEVDELWTINQAQLEILTLLRRLVDDTESEDTADGPTPLPESTE